MLCVGRPAVIKIARRCFSSTNVTLVRFRGTAPPPPELVRVGTMMSAKEEFYQPGQLFLHRLYAYRAIIVCSFNVKVHWLPKSKEAIGTSKMVPYYQVLINRSDWDYMSFRPDMTSYFVDHNTHKEEKVLSVINGMDCVAHNDIIPYSTTEKEPIKHDLFDRLFEKNEDSAEGTNFIFRRDLMSYFNLNNQKSWLTPQAVYHETTEGIEVTVIPFYLGPTYVHGQQKYFWRYIVRLQTLDGKSVVVRERLLKVFSLNNLQQVGGAGIDGGNPRLTSQNPVLQFSSTVELSQPKGGHMWGRFTLERDDGSTFEVTVPTIALESHTEVPGEQSENVVQ
uniref:ApaG domain-containing protein n=1 Tax=Panagrellus redivivus TaxID=6233 RepID=A0A7E4W4L1_PANRE